MLRKTLLAACAIGSLLSAQDKDKSSKKSHIDVENYVINAEINPRTQAIAANVQVRFVPLDADVSSTSFELNNALNVTRVVDDAGRQIPVSRSNQDSSVRVNFPSALAKGKPATLTFTYDGRLTGEEDSPVYGIKFAAIQNDFAYLMYPARWFPVSGYSVDRFTSDLHITVPSGYKVIASGSGSSQEASGGAGKTGKTDDERGQQTRRRPGLGDRAAFSSLELITGRFAALRHASVGASMLADGDGARVRGGPMAWKNLGGKGPSAVCCFDSDRGRRSLVSLCGRCRASITTAVESETDRGADRSAGAEFRTALCPGPRLPTVSLLCEVAPCLCQTAR